MGVEVEWGKDDQKFAIIVVDVKECECMAENFPIDSAGMSTGNSGKGFGGTLMFWNLFRWRT